MLPSSRFRFPAEVISQKTKALLDSEDSRQKGNTEQ